MNKYLGIVALVALVLGGISVAKKSVVEKEVVREVIKEVGGLPGPDISSSFLTVNGVTHHYFKQRMNTATQTVCTFDMTPGGATTTLIAASARYDTGSTTAFTTYIGKGAVVTATTTLLGQGYFAAGAVGTVIATSTPLDGTNEDKTFTKTAKYLNFGMYATEANSGGTFSPKGVCVAEAIEN